MEFQFDNNVQDSWSHKPHIMEPNSKLTMMNDQPWKKVRLIIHKFLHKSDITTWNDGTGSNGVLQETSMLCYQWPGLTESCTPELNMAAELMKPSNTTVKIFMFAIVMHSSSSVRPQREASHQNYLRMIDLWNWGGQEWTYSRSCGIFESILVLERHDVAFLRAAKWPKQIETRAWTPLQGNLQVLPSCSRGVAKLATASTMLQHPRVAYPPVMATTFYLCGLLCKLSIWTRSKTKFSTGKSLCDLEPIFQPRSVVGQVPAQRWNHPGCFNF